MKPMIRWSALAAGVLAVAAVGLWASQRGVAVQVVPVARAAIVQSVVATGRMNAPARIDVGAEITATVQDVRVREGDVVKAGTLLLRLSDAEARAAVTQARANLAEALNRATQQSTVAEPVARQTQAQAAAAYTSAQQDYQRTRELVAQGFYAQQKLDDAQRALDTAASALESARVQARANLAHGVEPALAAARVGQAQAALEAALARLARTQITSPVDAVVLARNVEPGSMAQPGHVLLALAAQGGIRIEAAIDEKNLRLLSPGMHARAVTDAFPGQPFEAQLNYIAPAVDAQRGTVDVRLAVPQPPAFLRPDMTVSVELQAGAKPDALVLPSSAVHDADREAPWVLVLREGRAVRVPVRLGLNGIGSVEILDGLQAGDEAIPQTEPASPGDRVRRGPTLAKEKGMEVPSFIQR